MCLFYPLIQTRYFNETAIFSLIYFYGTVTVTLIPGYCSKIFAVPGDKTIYIGADFQTQEHVVTEQ